MQKRSSKEDKAQNIQEDVEWVDMEWSKWSEAQTLASDHHPGNKPKPSTAQRALLHGRN